MRSDFSRTAVVIAAFASPVFALDLNEVDLGGGDSTLITAEIWVDNWFAVWANGAKLHEDSTAYKTERSFNAERIQFKAGLRVTLAFELRDFIENETGLEYIGSRRQQMGDGGAIAQFSDAKTGALLLASDGDWRCLVVQHLPVKASCAEEASPKTSTAACAQMVTEIPSDWKDPMFDDSGWPKAVVHSESDVGPKGGYDQITWNTAAKLIWGADLKRDNVVLCRAAISG
jgi:hypothetical protein